MSNMPICRKNQLDDGIRTGQTCGRFGRSEREVRREFHTPVETVVCHFPHCFHSRRVQPRGQRASRCGKDVRVSTRGARRAPPWLPRLGLRVLGRFGVDRSVELVVGQLTGHVLRGRADLIGPGGLCVLRGCRRVERIEI